MTLSRSEKAKEVWYQKDLAKLKPSTLERIQRHAAAEAVDAYEREHKLGKYTPQLASAAGQIAAAPRFPAFLDIHEKANNLVRLIRHGIHTTTKEGVRQDFELAEHHINVSLRYAHKATNQ